MRTKYLWAASGLWCLTSAVAAAQTPPPFQATLPEQQSVMTRARPDYSPLGTPLGAFILYPSFNAIGEYNSNVYATSSDVKGDFLTRLQPGIDLRSNWVRHALNFHAAGDFERYAKQTSENENNFATDVDGRLDIRTDTYMTGSLGYQLAHEPRTSPNTQTNQKNPTQYQLATGKIGFVRQRGIIGLDVDGQVNYYTYDNAVTGTGTPINESDRNRVEYSLTPRVTYQIVPGYRAFLQASGNERTYQSRTDQLGYQHDSHGYEVDAGTAIALTNLINGEIYAGYLEQFYKDSRLPTASGPGFGGNLLWNITPLTSIRAKLTRTVEEWDFEVAGSPPVSSYLATNAHLGIEHQLHDNLLATAGVDYENDAFQGITRNDNVYGASAGLHYLMNRYINVGLDLSYQRRNSNVANISYSQEIIGASIRLQY